MLGPTTTTRHMANQAYEERLSHAARIRMVQKERHDDSKPFHRDGHRLITARRLAAGLAGAVLATAIAAGTVANVVASPNHANGGGAALIR